MTRRSTIAPLLPTKIVAVSLCFLPYRAIVTTTAGIGIASTAAAKVFKIIGTTKEKDKK